MGKAILVYKDKAGNKLYRRYIKTRKKIQYSAKNKEGRLVTGSGVIKMIKRAKKASKL